MYISYNISRVPQFLNAHILIYPKPFSYPEGPETKPCLGSSRSAAPAPASRATKVQGLLVFTVEGLGTFRAFRASGWSGLDFLANARRFLFSMDSKTRTTLLSGRSVEEALARQYLGKSPYSFPCTLAAAKHTVCSRTATRQISE